MFCVHQWLQQLDKQSMDLQVLFTPSSPVTVLANKPKPSSPRRMNRILQKRDWNIFIEDYFQPVDVLCYCIIAVLATFATSLLFMKLTSAHY